MKLTALVLLLFVGGCAERTADRYTLTPEPEAFVAANGGRTQHRAAPHPDVTQAPQTATTPAPVASTETPAQRCERTRGERVAAAKDAVTAFRAKVKDLAPMLAFADKHHCELKDTTGTVLVTRERERNGGIRVSTKRGHQDELVCDTAKLPDGFDEETMRYINVLENTSVDDVLFSSYPECDANEKPSLRVTYGDVDGQKKILALP